MLSLLKHVPPSLVGVNPSSTNSCGRENQIPRRDEMKKKKVIPKFNGANDPEAYLVLEMKVD